MAKMNIQIFKVFKYSDIRIQNLILELVLGGINNAQTKSGMGKISRYAGI